GHGRWLKVLREQTRLSTQRASEYMRLAEGWDKLPPGGTFALKEALALLVGEEVPPASRAPNQPLPIMEWTAEARRKTAEKWWDILAKYTLLLDLQGWSAERI